MHTSSKDVASWLKEKNGIMMSLSIEDFKEKTLIL